MYYSINPQRAVIENIFYVKVIINFDIKGIVSRDFEWLQRMFPWCSSVGLFFFKFTTFYFFFISKFWLG